MKLWERYRKHIAIILIAILLSGAIILSATNQQFSIVNQYVAAAVAPVQVTIARVEQRIVDSIGYVGDLFELHNENQRLRAKLTEMNRQTFRLLQLERENQMLRQALNFQHRSPEVKIQAAKVIGRDPSSWLHMIVIDRGTKDGIAVGMTVMAVQNQQEGLVGRIVEASESSAKVLLIIDPQKQNVAAATVQGAEEEKLWHQGVVEGSATKNGSLEMMYIPHEAVVKDNGLVVTSSLGGHYIEGIPIGFVQSITVEGYGLLQRADVDPIVNFNRLEEVLVVTSPLPLKVKEGPAS